MKTKQHKTYFSRLMHDLFSYKTLLTLIILGTIIQVALSIYLPILIGKAIDSVLLSHFRSSLLNLLLQMGLIVMINGIMQWINPLLYNQLVYTYSSSLRHQVIEKIYHLPLAYLDKKSNGDLLSRTTTDLEQLTMGLLMVFNQFLVGLLTILVMIVSMAIIDVYLLLLVVFLTPMSLFIAHFIAKKSYYLFQKQTKARGVQTQLIEELLRQETLVQSLNAQAHFTTAFFKSNQSYSDYSKKAIFYSSSVNPATRFVNAFIYAVVVGLGAIQIISGFHLTIGQLVTFLSYVNQYNKPFNDISSVLAELQSALACAERLYSILDEKEVNSAGSVRLLDKNIKGNFHFNKVSFSYDKNQSLIENLSLDIPSGSKIAIVGPTGAGKSTLINLLMRFYQVDSGEILLDGQSITDYDLEDYRQQFGMVLQETWLKKATIHENIAFGKPKASRQEVVTAAKAANVDFFIRQLPNGYDTYLEDAGNSISQGQRQLLTIARIFLTLPKILILDEATSFIDTRTELLIQSAFNKLMVGKTCFIIAHRLSTIQNADIILVMVNGNIVEQGNHRELMEKKGKYYQMNRAQLF